MVTMSTTERPPRGLEYKATALAPAPATGGPPRGAAAVWEGVVAATGVPYGDVIYAPGAIGRSLTRLKPKGTYGRSWLRPVAIVEDAAELPPRDPRIPATLANGRPWPEGAGAVWMRLRFIIGTADGRAAYAAAQATGPAEWMLGFHVKGEKRRGGRRVIDEMDLYQLWPRSLDDDTGPGPEVKAAGVRLEIKAAGPARPSTRNRAGLTRVIACSVCRLPAAGVIPQGALRDGQSLICARCVGVMNEALDERVATIDPAEVEEVFGEPELTIEAEYEQAVEREEEYRMQPGGTLTRADQDPAGRGRAWSAGDRRAAPRW